MKWLIVAIAVILAPTAAAAQPLRPFDFMGYTAGEPIPADKLKKCGKGGDVTCFVPLSKIADVSIGYMLKTHGYKLSSVFVDANTDRFDRLNEAFTAKYGQPCERSVSLWRNAVGVEVDNPTSVWCFSSGKLMLSRHGGQLNKAGVLYEDDNQPPKVSPVVNF